MLQRLASIDIGSYTARMLVALKEDTSDKIIPIERKREYINIADSFEEPGIIKEDAIKRTEQVVSRFVSCAYQKGAEHIFAIGTGLIRIAKNREELINRLERAAGIKVVPISGKEEAYLTAAGVIYSLKIKSKSFVIVDIGGGSTEFFIKKEDRIFVTSIPIGAAILYNKYILSEPPQESELYKVCVHVKGMLKEINNGDVELIIGTGGTLTAVCAVLYGISIQDICPENINGRILEYDKIKKLFNDAKLMDINKRASILGLDKKRAKVIIPGIIILMNIMKLFSLKSIIVSLSDLLEGILLKPCVIQGGK